MLGPLLGYDLLTQGRRTSLYVTRGLYALCLLIAFCLSQADSDDFSSQAVAERAYQFFSTFSIMQLIAVWLITPAYVAGAVASERERRTIEYLFATDLRSWEIVLGRLFGRLASVASILLAGAPVLALSLMLGGVSGELILLSVVVTISTVLVIGAVSLLMSVRSEKARDAVIASYMALLLYLIAPSLLLIEDVWEWLPYHTEVVYAVFQLNPFTVWAQYLAAPQSISDWSALTPLGIMVALHLGISLVAVTWSVWSIRPIHLGQQGRPKGAAATAPVTRRGWQPSLDEQPMLWKEVVGDRRRSSRLVLALLGLVTLVYLCLVGWSAVMLASQDHHQHESAFMMAAFANAAVFSVALLLIGARAATSIASERERDTWVSLVSTPLSGPEIIGAKAIGSAYGPTVFALGLILLTFVAAFLTSPPLAILALVGSVIVQAILATFAAFLGLFFSLVFQNSGRAITVTIASLAFCAVGYLFVMVPVMMIARLHHSMEAMIWAPCIPFLLAGPSALAIGESGSETGTVVGALVVGGFLYFCAGAALYQACCSRFRAAAEQL